MARVISIILLIGLYGNIFAKPCVGKFINPITDVCYSCLFPISIGAFPVNFSSQRDTKNPTSPICACSRPPLPVPLPGISIGFWEPVRLVEITRTPYCMVGLGGLSMGGGIKGHGAINSDEHDLRRSFYQVHYYIYPLLYWLELLTDFMCLEMTSFDVAWMSELDPTWNNDEWGAILNPEAILFSSLPLQAACAADCTKATVSFPFDSLAHCGGCQGSLYPFTGHVANHNGGVDSSLLLTQRMLAKLHRLGLAWETSGSRALCEKKLRLVIKKSQYKTQMVYPKASTNSKTACNPLGKTSVIWGAGREFPYKGEDFVYLIWRKRNCCAL